MKLRALEKDDLEVVAHWMAEEENYRWLDFGAGQQILTASALAVVRQREIHCLKLYTADTDEHPLGVVALSNIAPAFKSATLWYVLGDKRYAGHGHTSRAVARMLTLGFRELALESVNAWVVETNAASIRILKKNGFRLIGRQRRCHWVGGGLRDRLLFDILVTEHPA